MDEGSRDLTRCFELLYFFVTGAADARMASAAGRWTLRGNAHLKEHVPTVQTRSPRAGCCGSLSDFGCCVVFPRCVCKSRRSHRTDQTRARGCRRRMCSGECRRSIVSHWRGCLLHSCFSHATSCCLSMVWLAFVSGRLLGSHNCAGPQAIRCCGSRLSEGAPSGMLLRVVFTVATNKVPVVRGQPHHRGLVVAVLFFRVVKDWA